MELSEKVTIVTGAAQGIGAAIAAHIAGLGGWLALFDLDSEQASAGAKRLADEHGTRAVGVGVDVSSYSDVERAVSQTQESLGPVDVLVNNAGIDVIAPFFESHEKDWDRVLAVNLKGVFNLCHVVAPKMAERGSGRIVNIASDAGRVGSSGEAVYSASKGGVIAFTKALAREVARSGVTVNCVCPGPTDTALLGQLAGTNERIFDAMTKAIPMKRIGQPDDIAPVVAFLAGDGARYMTGQTVSVSGGLTMC